MPLTNLFVSEKVFNESNRVLVVKQVLQALNYLDTMNVVHRDLKPENIMYSSDSKVVNWEKLQVRVIDFGFAASSNNNSLD